MIPIPCIKKLNQNPLKDGDYVLYWMQASPRVHTNHALEYSIKKANQIKKPLLVFFGITNQFPEANNRHYTFLLQGLQDVQNALEKQGINMAIQMVSPPEGALELAENASMVVVDRGYLSIQREWIQKVIDGLQCPLIQVETNVVIPVETASSKEEYSAATIRRKINKKLDEFLIPLKREKLSTRFSDLDVDSLSLDDVDSIISRLGSKSKVVPVAKYEGGTGNAIKLLDTFIKHKLDKFPDRNDPSTDYLSHMSPYLHFGQISPLHIALEVLKTKSPGKSAYLEELIIRRELAVNFVYHNHEYDKLKCLPDWAYNTLMEHRKDKREYIYSFEEFENAETHDPYWNAAQLEMVHSGKMQGYMRMYWGKKILEWTQNPEEAHQIALKLNNRYELDGRDPNGYAGVAWCFGKHDRAWKEREIFGKVRYMNDQGLRRKFKMDSYLDAVNNLVDSSVS
ncbi:deoxyribodipyrimidine photolyase PhrB [Methanobacterium formicicum]|jgi:deoxyribodipyrimidine photo-lyase|uniref:Deoxyribodipyrimidine photo-lyase n=1 Tax=Methanobacterium formicicum TaxID=2162 RepID=A0A089ZIP5_METFO|nr:deoxyribodipyrimidine photo-lyase [Methanobacterium formicicum]AIS32673.1 deoxyribodipyrimidine photolyase PhrB [Methanobacterium formicicum]